MSDLKLNLWWEPHDPSRANDARKLSRFVSGLPDFDPIYESWLKSPINKEVTVPVPLSEIQAKQLLIDNVTQYELSARPWPELGSNIWGGHAGPPPYDFRESSTAGTRCYIGRFGRSATIYPNHVFMRLSKLRPSTGRSWRASELRPLMKFAREIWKPAEMCAMFSFYRLPRTADQTFAAGERVLQPRIGWITYLPQNLADRANYPAEVEVEALDDGAALVTLCEEPFEKTDAEGLARLRALEAALRPLQS
jgi:Immunity protein 52